MIRLVAAIDRKRGISKQGIQPWYIPDDFKYFKTLTQQFGAVVLVGDVTFKALNGPLENRHTYVLTHNKEPIEGVELVHDLERFIRDWQDKDVWVIGGANVFAQVMELDRADEVYVTRIEADFGCNQFFPLFEDKFKLVEQSELHEQNGFIYYNAKYLKQTSI